MPLYSDSNYYYSGGSSQLYSPYYSPGSSSSSYTPYSPTYNRTYGGSYVVPLTPPRTPTYTSHGLSSRYQPKLSTITETSPLISSARHTTLMPLTRIQSPKYSTYSSPSTTATTSKYIAPRPIPINTADIDVSASRYRKRREEREREEQAEARLRLNQDVSSPGSSIKRRNSQEKPKEETAPKPEPVPPAPIPETDRKTARSTIKRNRAVVRLSTVRSRSKDRNSKSTSTGTEQESSPEPDPKLFRDLPHAPEVTENVSWRQKLADDLAAIPTYPTKKSPGELMRERYLIQDATNAVASEDVADSADKVTITVEPEPLTIDKVVVELDPLHHTIRRLSIPQCPTFHDICEDISSDKIDDDLNAGELRRRASLIQEQEQEILNQLQKSASGTFQLIHLERQGSHDSLADESAHHQPKRKSKKGKKVRHKITAIVDIENAPLATIPQEKEEDLTTPANKETKPKPKFTFNVESVEEHHEINEVFKLPKKKSVKKTITKAKDSVLPEGFVHAIPKVKSSPKAKNKTGKAEVKAEVFTFEEDKSEKSETEKIAKNEKNLEKKQVTKKEKLSEINATIEEPINAENKILLEKTQIPVKTTVIQPQPESSIKTIDKQPKQETCKPPTDTGIKSKLTAKTAAPLKTSTSVDAITAKVVDKTISKSKSEDLQTPTTPKAINNFEALKKPIKSNLPTPPTIPSTPSTLTTPMSPKSKNVDEPNKETPPQLVATPKPIKKSIQKSDSGEDFWSQIGSRETLYMTNRKKALLEDQWQKRENLLNAQSTDNVKNLGEIKTAVSEQKQQALQRADVDCESTNKTLANRSQSIESNLKKKSPKQTTTKQKTSPKKKTPPVKVKSPKKTMKNVETTTTTTAIAPAATELTKTTPITVTTSATTAITKTTTATTTTAVPKISSGQVAKSPEQQSQQPNEFAVKSESENKMANTSEQAKKPIVTTNTKQPETSGNKSIDIDKKTVTKTSNVDDKAKLPATKTPKIIASKTAKTSPTTAPTINADQFVTSAPAKAATSPSKNKTTTTSIATTTSTTTVTSPSTPTSVATTAGDKNKATITIATSATTTIESTPPPTTTATTTKTTTTFATAATTTNTSTLATATAAKNTIANTDTDADVDADADAAIGGGGKNLAKFATVSNLAQCLQDVDAELDDYIPSSAENSDDDSSYDYSSADGCENLSASMKKKLRQRRRKEKLAEQARFDPQKKIKIDPSKKCYVQEEETPRYTLVATPRPLWKREKIVYPAEDSDDSDSDDNGSTEETEDSEECSTSEYEDELRPSAAASGSNASKENSAIIRMSTCSNDSGFEGGTAPSSPKKMLETSYTYSQFQKSGRFTAPATVIPRFKNYSVDDFHFLAVLGKGSFGKVLLAELRDTTYYYAVKCLKKDVVLEDDDVDSTLIERKVLALGTKHPYLCHLFCTFQTESHLFFVMEYLNGGDLMFHIQESGRFTEDRARFYGAEIISGLKFLHKKGIIYRDLKLDNVLLDYEGHVRIADFGMCKLQIYLDKTADSFCGTPDYMAPEIIKGEKYNQNVDWWSFGVLLYEMLIGQSPFSGCDEEELFWSICNLVPWFPVYISAEATSILKGLLEKDYTKRVGSQYSPAGDISEHIFFRPIDWNLLEKRQLEPPFKPQVKHPLDTQYFDRVFTRERVRLTPIDKDILQSMDQKQFLGFTYTNPHITLD